jgi:hypothetical protein
MFDAKSSTGGAKDVRSLYTPVGCGHAMRANSGRRGDWDGDGDFDAALYYNRPARRRSNVGVCMRTNERWRVLGWCTSELRSTRVAG